MFCCYMLNYHYFVGRSTSCYMPYIFNRIPMKKNQIIPYELWKGRKPIIGYLKVLVYLAYYKNIDPTRTKEESNVYL